MVGREKLQPEELERVREACDIAEQLNSSKQAIYQHVESKMSFIAPNLSAVVGASTAAKLMGTLWTVLLYSQGLSNPHVHINCAAQYYIELEISRVVEKSRFIMKAAHLNIFLQL